MDRGFLSCFDAATGKAHYIQERMPRGSLFKASPIAAGEHLYCAAENGDVYLVKLGEEFELAATNSLPEQFFVASPVAVNGNLILRSRSELICISDGAGRAPPRKVCAR